MSIEEEWGWSLRDNHCSTFKQYVKSVFTPKGRLRRRDFIVITLILFLVWVVFFAMSSTLCEYYANVSYHDDLNPRWDGYYIRWFLYCLMDCFLGFLFFGVIFSWTMCFWWNPVFLLLLSILEFMPASPLGLGWLIVSVLFVSLCYYLVLCCCVRRLHDSDRSGWQSLLLFIPILNWYLLFLLLFAADKETNEYGSDPRKPYEGQYENTEIE